MARFYVCTKSNWQGDNWRPVAGPFGTREEAESKAGNYEYHPHRETGGIDTKSERHARAFSRTELAKLGFPNSPQGDLELSEALFLSD
jgi:hypothetical protein